LYAIFRRNQETGDYWQGIAGGGEDHKSPLEAAHRESGEGAGLHSTQKMYQLDAQCMVPSAKVCGLLWGPDILEISEHAFAVAVEGPELHIRKEHSEYRWVTYEEELRHLHWDSNRVPLGELSQRLTARDEI